MQQEELAKVIIQGALAWHSVDHKDLNGSSSSVTGAGFS